MDDATRSRLHELILGKGKDQPGARTLLMTEARELLEGVYGLRAGSRFEPAGKLFDDQTPQEVRQTRARLDAYLEDEQAAGLAGADAVGKLVKEVAFTHLNRLVAFKMMESRKLIRGTLDRYHDANAFKFYLAEHPDDLARYEDNTLPEGPLAEGSRDTAYRHFLLWQSGELAREVKVLFDSTDFASQLFPRPRALKAVTALLNDVDMQAAWAPGNEETIGWIYQYFNEPDLDIFRSARAPKVPPHLVAAKTQQFTPRWIVTYLVQNTLGCLWLQMHPDSNLGERWKYLVPLAAKLPPLTPKAVREITVLDPACGTMHFGLVAFDVLASMYEEEMERAGSPGWPMRPSVDRVEEIPVSIMEHNLYGIDIDLRAVQLSALTLYLKAKSMNRAVTIRQSNLVCADIRLLKDDHLDEFLGAMRFTRPVYERIIRSMWSRLQDVSQVGSLLRIDEDMQELIKREQKGKTADSPLFPDVERYGDAYEGAEDFWEMLDDLVVQAFDEFARQQASKGIDETYFTGEATKGMRLLDVMMRRYDVVVTNPPYLDNRDYNARLKTVIDKLYPTGKRNLYAAFLLRCQGFLNPEGRLGIITPQTFMFISSFAATRDSLRQHVAIESLVHTGLNTFPDAVVDCAFYVLRSEPDTLARASAIGTYFRLTKEPDAQAKQRRFEQALTRLSDGQSDPAIYHYRQGDFDAISGAPWVYWITPSVRRLFATLPKLEEVAQPRQGLATTQNFRFLRTWWEVGNGRIGFGLSNLHQADSSRRRWFPYMKGGSFQRWYGNQEYVVNWHRNGTEIKEQICVSYPYLQGKWEWVAKNITYYFRSGVTYSYLTSGTFSARASPGGFIFDVAGSSLFPDDIPLVLAAMNSTFAAYALKLINPTVNFQVGDLARLPIPDTDSDVLQSLVDRAISLAKAGSTEDETTYDFIAPPAWPDGAQDVADRHARLAAVEREIDEEVYRLYDIGPEDRAAIEAELSEPAAVENEDDGADAQATGADDEGVPAQDDDVAATEGVAGRLTAEDLARRWLSYAVGIVLGRFEPGADGALGRGCFAPEVAAELRALAVPDGIAVVDDAHPDDLAPRVMRALDLMLGTAGAEEVVAAATGGKSLPAYLRGDFYKEHVRRYRQRPVYWLLQSPRRHYSLLLFHERLTADTLYRVAGTLYLGAAINRGQARAGEIGARIEPLREAARTGAAVTAAQRRELRRLDGELEDALAVLRDLETFRDALAAVTAHRDERGEVAGWRPEIDDGVLLNLAPLHGLIPAWSKEPREAWAKLARGDYDWSHTAMRYWPERVRAVCRANKSYAIAHGLEAIPLK